jgi:hypothetical protein
MSFLAPKVDLPNSLADNTPGRTARQSPTQVVPLGFGRYRVVVQWVTPVLHWHYKSDKTSQTAYFSGFGIACLGPVDEIVGLIVNNKPYHGVFKSREDYPGDYIEHTYSKPVPEVYRFYWGLETTANYSAYINSLVRDANHPMYGKTHPAYRGVLGFGVKDFEAGQSAGGQTPPLPQIELEVIRRSVSAYSFGGAAHGTHSIGIAKDILTLKRGGLKLPGSYFDDAHWTAKMTELQDVGVAGMLGDELWTSHVFAEPKEAGEQIADVLSYFDGFLQEREGKLRIGYSPNDGSSLNPAGLTQINQHHLAGEITDDTGDLDELPSQVIVAGLDMMGDPALSEASETEQVPFARRLLGEQRPPRTYNRPGFTLRSQLKSCAKLMAAIVANPDWEATVPILRQYAVHPDAVTPLRPGDLFILNVDQVGGINVVVRVLSRESDTPVEVVLKVRRERGTFPRAYQAVLDPRASTTPPVPQDLARYAVVELPPAMSVVPAVTTLVERPSKSVAAYEVHFAPTDTWPGQVIATLNAWTVACVNRTALAAVTADTTITVDTVGADWDYLASQSALQQSDDRLVAYHGGEWFSVGTITPIGGGQYTLALKRVRLDSEPATHANGDVFHLIFREQLPELRHASFSDIYVLGVYDVTTATKWFKLRPQNNGGFGNFTAALSLIIAEPDVVLEDPNLWYDFRFKRSASGVPATPSGEEPAGWSDGPPAGSDPLYMSRAVKRVDTGAIVVDWTTPVRLDGEAGVTPPKHASVFIYKRSASAPSLPSVDATFTFATGAISGLDNGWTQTVPGGTDPLYVATASAVSTGTTDTITAAEWAAPQILAQNGAAGGAGGNSAPVLIYQRAASSPTLPSTTATYTFATGGITGLNNGWTQGVPSGSDPLWVAVATAFNTAGTDNIAAGEWAAPVKLAENGAVGASGLNVASAFIYKRSASAPSLPGATATFTFATGALSGLDNGWTQTVPGGTDPLYVSTASAASTGATDNITSGEWATPQILAQNGTNGGAGGNSAPVFIYQRAGSSPTLPSATATFTFATGGITGLNNGWTQGVPSGTSPLWVSVATAFGTGATDTIASGEWATPVKLAENGSDGSSVEVEYSVDGSTSWHSTFTGGDKYMRQRIGGGAWSAAIKIVGENGTNGTNGGTVLGQTSSIDSFSSSSFVDSGISIPVTSNANARAIAVAGNMEPDNTGRTLTLRLLRDGTPVDGERFFTLPGGAGTFFPVVVIWTDTPGAGSFTYKIQGKRGAAGVVSTEMKAVIT